MADKQQDFDSLMRRVRQGSQGAAREVLEYYGPYIIQVIRHRLTRDLRSKYDSGDFLQAVWASFFAAVPQKLMFGRPEALAAYLAAMARNKVVEALRQRRGTQKYDVARELSLYGPSGSRWAEPAARQPTPSQLAVAREEWDRLQEGLPERYRRILELLRDGYTHEEIARALSLNEKTIRRVIRLIAPRLIAP